ncbi:SGT1-domain-containing protein [Parathielavia hyrcaniae]|uniref:SGT1-domain-containing protein n=1 Tax=Parathielavia hyrcaniae TaxID=113614 RepID=A0AAN6SZV8_9PEZI|nr:SGT1-domain-containing protein [Parathielavia hyrcaniae]
MDNAREPRPGDEDFDGFRMRLPEDCVEYMLFVIGDKTSNALPSLEAVRKAADQKLHELAKDYIWQREPFRLDTKLQNGLGLPYIHGTTHYGDNVEDEWLIVYLLRELSKTFPSLWIRVSDSDGEFLLIEAARVTPKWLSPENDANRVWIHDGKLLIIPPSSVTSSNTPITTPTLISDSKPLTLAEAISTLKTTPSSALVHSPLVEAEAFYRLEKYPSHIPTSLHHSPATIPRKLAYVLHALPKAVAPATEAFYLRTADSLKPLRAAPPSPSPSSSRNLVFPPADLVTVSVRFTRVLYAQLVTQHFSPPSPAWRNLLREAEVEFATTTTTTTTTTTKTATAAAVPESKRAEQAEKKLARLELGMKLTTGFEILMQTAHESRNRVVREVVLLLADLDEDGGDDGDVVVLPSDEEIFGGWEGVNREDDDGWMDIDFEEFERELGGEKSREKGKEKGGAGGGDDRGGGGGGGRGFGDAATQADLQKIVSRFEAFLNDETAGIEGAEVEEMDRDNDSEAEEEEDDGGRDEEEDREVSFDEEQFARMMREMMGLPAEDEVQKKGKAKAFEEEAALGETAHEDENEDEKARKLMELMESELKGHGVLDLDAKPKATFSITAKGEGSSRAGAGPLREEDDDEGSDEEVDIDYNLAKNLLESFKSQGGMAGPAGNLLGLMGMTLPRDDEEDSDGDIK